MQGKGNDMAAPSLRKNTGMNACGAIIRVTCLVLCLAALVPSPLRAEEGAAVSDTPPAADQGIDWKKGKWGHLAPFIGTDKYDAVLNDPAVAAEVDALLSPDDKKHLMDNLSVAGPIGFEGDCLTLSGNAPHQGGSELGFVNLCLYNGAVHVGILSGGAYKVYTRSEKYDYLPPSLRNWVIVTKAGFSMEKPDGVTMIQPFSKPE